VLFEPIRWKLIFPMVFTKKDKAQNDYSHGSATAMTNYLYVRFSRKEGPFDILYFAPALT
jgi:hypothetical protein